MRIQSKQNPDKLIHVWESTQVLYEFSSWLPEVVGDPCSLVKEGFALVSKPKPVSNQRVKRIPLDDVVEVYRQWLNCEDF